MVDGFGARLSDIFVGQSGTKASSDWFLVTGD